MNEGSLMKRFSTFFTSFSLLIVCSSIAFATTYYSKTGQANASTTSSWSLNSDGSGTTPANFTSGDIFIIQSGHTMTSPSGNWIISGLNSELQVDGTLNITTSVAAAILTVQYLKVSPTGILNINSGSTLIVNNGAGAYDLVVDGTLNNSSTISNGPIIYSSGATGQINGTYDHQVEGDTIPTFNWSSNSLCRVSGIFYAANLYGLNQNFYNFTYNCINSQVITNFNSQLTNVSGLFNIQSTGGAGSINLFNTNNAVLNVGEFSLTSGTLNFSPVGSGFIDTIRITKSGGSFSQGGGSSITTQGGPGAFHFTNDNQYGSTIGTIGSSIGFRVSKYFTAMSGITTTASFVVDSGATLYMQGSANISGTGSFNLKSGATLKIENINGISSSGQTGPIQVNGIRTYDIGGSYEYSGTSAQNTGSGLPSSIRKLVIDNPSGVTLFNAVIINDTLTLKAGQFDIGSKPVTINGPVSSGGSGYFNSSSVGTVSYNLASSGQNVITNNSQYGNLTFNNFTKVLDNNSLLISGIFTPGTAAHTVGVINTIEFNGAGAQTIPPFNYANLSITGARGANNVTLSNADTIYISESFIPTAIFSGGDFITTGTTIKFNGVNSQIIPTFHYYNLTISGTHGMNNVTLSSTDTIHILGDFNPIATFSGGDYITTGTTIEFNGFNSQTIPSFHYYNLTLSGTRVANNVTLTNSDTIFITGVFTPTASFTTGNFFTTGSTIEFNGGNGQMLPVLPNNVPYNNIVMNKNTAGLNVGGVITLNGDLSLQQGNLYDNGFVLTVKGNILGKNGTHWSISGGEILLTSGASQHQIGGVTFGKIEINDLLGVSTTGNLAINNLVLTNGIFTLNNDLNILPFGTIYAASGNLSATHRVIFSGDGTVTGTVLFDSVQINGAVDFGNGSTINGALTINFSGMIATNPPTYANGSTLVYSSGGNFIRGWEWSSTSGAGYPYNVQLSNNTELNLGANGGTGIARQIAGNLTVDLGSTLWMNQTGFEMTEPLTVLKNVTIDGSLVLSSLSGGDLKLGGNLSVTTGSNFVHNNRTVWFFGSSSQTISETSISLLQLGGMKVENGSNNVMVNCGLEIVDTLSMFGGNISTGLNYVKILSTGTVERISGAVVGNLRKDFSLGINISKRFEVGDGTTYTPLDITFATISNAGYLNVHADSSGPSLAGSDINPTKKVKKYWSVFNYGIIFDTYDATFHFTHTDVDSGIDYNKFIVAKSFEFWSKPIVGIKTDSSTQIFGADVSGTFAVGEIQTFMITASIIGNGTILPPGISYFNLGDTANYSFTPNIRNHFDSLYVDAARVYDSTSHYTFVNVTSAHSIDVYFSASLNIAPRFSLVLSDTAIARFDTLYFQYHAYDPDSGKISFSLLNSPSGVSIDSTGLLTFIPAANSNGIYSIIVQVMDDSFAVVNDTAKIRVNIYGDVSGNGSISSFDASLILRHVVGIDTLKPLQIRIADVSGSNSISSLDASYILQYAVGIISSFPGGLGKQQRTEVVLSAFSFRIEKSKDADEYDLYISVNKPSQVYGVVMDLDFDSTVVMPKLFAKTAITDSMMTASKIFAEQVKFAMAGIYPLNKAGDVIKFTFMLKNPNYPKNALLFTMKKFMLNETDHTNDIGEITLNVRDLAQLPTEYKLEQNFPNPFNPTTTISYQLPNVNTVTISIYNMLGQEVRTLIHEQQIAGYYSMVWNGTDNANRKVSSGVYIYRIEATGPHQKRFSEVKKMLMIK
jgi:hypothetical protein